MKIYHCSGAKTGSQVGGAGEDPSEVVVAHEVCVVLLEHFLDLLGALGESGDDALDVVALLHRDDAHLILLVHPDKEVLRLVVENSF